MTADYARFNFQPCLPLGSDGRRVTASQEHIDLSRRAAADGMVLLKNENGALPLQKGERIALFGKACIQYVKGGGGSGDVNCPYIRNIYDGFAEKQKEGKVRVYAPLEDFYKKYVEEESVRIPTQDDINRIWDVVNAMEFCQKRDDMTYDTFQSMFVKEADVPDDLIISAAREAETAIFTVSRFSAEGTDRRDIPGDYRLSETETRLLDRLCKNFEKVIVVLNSGAVLDCEYFAENDKIGGLLLAWQAGMEGGAAIADILCGDVNPSGRLPDTIVKTYGCYPDKDDFAECFEHVNYTNDIYVGYRYFSTVPGMEKYVRYPFGHGLSYTSFETSGLVAGEKDGRITVAFTVKNTGGVKGRNAVGVYYSAPQGKLGKPRFSLAEFTKTKLLAPGEEQTLAVSFPVKQMASFDDTGKIKKNAYVLEKGSYSFYAGAGLDELKKTDYEYVCEADTVSEQCGDYCAPFRLEKRMLSDGSFETLETKEPSYFYGGTGSVKYEHKDTCISFAEVGRSVSLEDFTDQMTLEEMKDFVGGQPPTGVANTGCFGPVKRLGVPAVPTADGPAGLRLNTETGIPTTAFPCATLLAATWDKELVFEVGSAAAAEIRENNIGVWLAPAVNIHKNPLCGRNFEYFSEDPVLAGKMCGAEIRGIQSQKVAVSLKHFACNNKEANRFGCDSRLSARALREIFLKCFEFAVKEGRPYTIMSSYNLINGIHTSESWELLTGILRNEWGFDGMVVTDWGQKNDPVKELKAGNDMKMHRGYPDDLQKGLDDGIITPENLKLCCMRILDMFTKVK